MRACAGVVAASSVLFLVVTAHAEGPPLGELDALRLELLVTQRQLIQERAGRVAAESQLEYAAKGRELDAALGAAAARAGVDLREGWRPDVGKRAWLKQAK